MREQTNVVALTSVIPPDQTVCSFESRGRGHAAAVALAHWPLGTLHVVCPSLATPSAPPPLRWPVLALSWSLPRLFALSLGVNIYTGRKDGNNARWMDGWI